jgi:hypothetical protein
MGQQSMMVTPTLPPRGLRKPIPARMTNVALACQLSVGQAGKAVASPAVQIGVRVFPHSCRWDHMAQMTGICTQNRTRKGVHAGKSRSDK